jgi:hypothetical protein
VPGIFNYTTNTTNSTYMLNTNMLSFQDADLFCQDQGGRLVSYRNLAEQVGHVCCCGCWLAMSAGFTMKVVFAWPCKLGLHSRLAILARAR